MIPNKIPTRASKGEEICFSILKNLPEDCLVYYEPIIGNRYPDFIVILPRHGVIVIEVKGWYPANLKKGDSETIFLQDRESQIRQDHPCRQARDYMLRLMDKARENLFCDHLIHPEGHEWSGRFTFPFGNFSILSNIRRDHLTDEWSNIFPRDRVLTRDELDELEDLKNYNLENKLVDFFNPYWPIDIFSKDMINLIREIVHPEIKISNTPSSHNTGSPEVQTEKSIKSLKVLDYQQEAYARNIGNGHRLVFGVAGSGKTVLLIARIRFLAQQFEPNQKILVLCYNICFASYLEGVLRDLCSQVDVMHFHRLGRKLGVRFKKDEKDENYGQRVMDAIISDPNMPHSYKALAIDEAQDFASTWFQCALELTADPMDADVLLAGDGTQSIFRRKAFTWKEVGIKAQGRTDYLENSYRTSSEIMRFAEVFSFQEQEQEVGGIPAVNAKRYIRNSDFKPYLINCITIENELQIALSIITGLIEDGNWIGSKTPQKLDPNEIGVFYRSRKTIRLVKELQQELENRSIPYMWLSEPNGKNRDRVWEPGIKFQTGQSCKGLQYKAVIILEANEMPLRVADVTEKEEKKLF